jgi:(p)ppGpp synthase/HD superfamily hydrolase
MELSEVESRARAFALSAHGEQRYGTHPYVVHLSAVRATLAEFGHAGELLVAAWLHDTLEDTTATRVEMRAEFGAEVEALVWAVTGRGDPRLWAALHAAFAGDDAPTPGVET